MRVIALHGRRQMAEIFAQRLDKLTKQLKSQYATTTVFVEAPYTLPLEADQDVATRSWFENEAWLQHEPLVLVAFSQGCVVAALLCLLARMSNGGLLGGTDLPPDVVRLLSTLESRIRMVVCAGGPGDHFPTRLHSVCNMTATAGLKLARPLAVPSLHYIGTKDPLVSEASSRTLAAVFVNPTVVLHSQGHVFPTAKLVLEPLYKLLDTTLPLQASSQQTSSAVDNEEQQLELEGLAAVFDNQYELIRERPPTVAVRLDVDDTGNGAARLLVTLPPEYPEIAPIVEVVGIAASLDVHSKYQAALGHAAWVALQDTIIDNLGSPMIYQLVEEAKLWLVEQHAAHAAGSLTLSTDVLGSKNSPAAHPPTPSPPSQPQSLPARITPPPGQVGKHTVVMQGEEDDLTPEEVQQLIEESTAEAARIAQERGAFVMADQGAWKYTVGLVGKPSAGKSTFFNAVTDPEREADIARVAAFPFTTIDPNVGQGYFSSLCPSISLGLTAQPENGWMANKTDRKVGIIVKDVAGLVPGAYQGRGKGNAFLNDLCDADVLIHIVDASGRSDREGVTSTDTAGDPCDDIQWVREELHRWIYNNVRHKWVAASRKDDRLYGMFSGYQCKRGAVEEALRRTGVNLSKPLEDVLPTWEPKELHLLIANFLRVRFPILLGLNKVDLDASHVQRIRSQYPNDPAVAMVAEAEWGLCQLRRAGKASYETNACSFTLAPDVDAKLKSKEPKLQQAMALVGVCNAQLSQPAYSSTGVAGAINAAVALAQPLLVYPVLDLATCASLPLHEGSRGAILQHCLLMKPGSSVQDVYTVLKRPPFQALSGDYVRGECLDRSKAPAATHPLRKTDPLTAATAVVKIMTNRKSNWQQHHS